MGPAGSDDFYPGNFCSQEEMLSRVVGTEMSRTHSTMAVAGHKSPPAELGGGGAWLPSPNRSPSSPVSPVPLGLCRADFRACGCPDPNEGVS